jgi:hypothetical protein
MATMQKAFGIQKTNILNYVKKTFTNIGEAKWDGDTLKLRSSLGHTTASLKLPIVTQNAKVQDTLFRRMDITGDIATIGANHERLRKLAILWNSVSSEKLGETEPTDLPTTEAA